MPRARFWPPRGSARPLFRGREIPHIPPDESGPVTMLSLLPPGIVASLGQLLQPPDGDSQLLLDSSGNDYHAQFGNDPGVDAADPTRIPLELVDHFVANDVQITNPSFVVNGGIEGFTLAFVIQRLAAEDSTEIFVYRDDGQPFGRTIVRFSTGVNANKLEVFYAASGSTSSSVIVPSDGARHSVIVRKVGGFGNSQIFIDGVSVGANNQGGEAAGANPRLYWGGFGTGLANSKLGTRLVCPGYYASPAEVAGIHAAFRHDAFYPDIPE